MMGDPVLFEKLSFVCAMLIHVGGSVKNPDDEYMTLSYEEHDNGARSLVERLETPRKSMTLAGVSMPDGLTRWESIEFHPLMAYRNSDSKEKSQIAWLTKIIKTYKIEDL